MKTRYASPDTKVSTNEARYMFDVDHYQGTQPMTHIRVYGSGPMIVDLYLTDNDKKALIAALIDGREGDSAK